MPKCHIRRKVHRATLIAHHKPKELQLRNLIPILYEDFYLEKILYVFSSCALKRENSFSFQNLNTYIIIQYY